MKGIGYQRLRGVNSCNEKNSGHSGYLIFCHSTVRNCSSDRAQKIRPWFVATFAYCFINIDAHLLTCIPDIILDRFPWDTVNHSREPVFKHLMIFFWNSPELHYHREWQSVGK